MLLLSLTVVIINVIITLLSQLFIRKPICLFIYYYLLYVILLIYSAID